MTKGLQPVIGEGRGDDPQARVMAPAKTKASRKKNN
jgi:hypothetical protein